MALPERALEQSEILASEDTAQHLHGQEEGILGMNPARVIWIEAAGGNDAVEVRMQAQVLSPRMQNAEEADPGSEMPRGRLRLRAWSELWRGRADRRKQARMSLTEWV